MGFKQKYAYRKLKRLVVAQNRSPQIPALAQHSKVGVIWQPSEKSAVQFLRDHFNQQGAIFRDYCVFDNDSNPASELNALCATDINWWGIPKPEKTDDFINTEFELLLILAQKPNFAIDYLSALSKARFKIGSSPSNENHFDLNIKIAENKDASYLAKQQIFYLAQLNKNSN